MPIISNEVIGMKHLKGKILLTGLLLTMILSNAGSIVNCGREADRLRSSMLRLHILADSDSSYDQWLKLKVRDEILRISSDVFGSVRSLEEAEETVSRNLGRLEDAAETVLRRYGCFEPVSAALETVDFDRRTYGDLTVPAGEYRALRLKIGSAEGHNWWCVMYPAMCIPVVYGADSDTETAMKYFNSRQLDIMKKPEKYRIRLAVWDKAKELKKKMVGESDENGQDA